MCIVTRCINRNFGGAVIRRCERQATLGFQFDENAFCTRVKREAPMMPDLSFRTILTGVSRTIKILPQFLWELYVLTGSSGEA
jgi:hypothetical protein